MLGIVAQTIVADEPDERLVKLIDQPPTVPQPIDRDCDGQASISQVRLAPYGLRLPDIVRRVVDRRRTLGTEGVIPPAQEPAVRTGLLARSPQPSEQGRYTYGGSARGRSRSRYAQTEPMLGGSVSRKSSSGRLASKPVYIGRFLWQPPLWYTLRTTAVLCIHRAVKGSRSHTCTPVRSSQSA